MKADSTYFSSFYVYVKSYEYSELQSRNTQGEIDDQILSINVMFVAVFRPLVQSRNDTANVRVPYARPTVPYKICSGRIYGFMLFDH